MCGDIVLPTHRAATSNTAGDNMESILIFKTKEKWYVTVLLQGFITCNMTGRDLSGRDIKQLQNKMGEQREAFSVRSLPLINFISLILK